jgi:hypothetical protein
VALLDDRDPGVAVQRAVGYGDSAQNYCE